MIAMNRYNKAHTGTVYLGANNGNFWWALTQPIHLFPGTYTYSFWLWQVSGSKPIDILWSRTNDPSHPIQYFDHVNKYEQWVKVTETIKVTKEDNYNVRVENGTNPTNVYIGDIKLEQGDKATTYIG